MNLVELFDNIVQMQNLNGVPLAAGKLYVYALGRTRLMDTWSDVDGENLNPNPIILDNAGQAHVFVSDDFDYTLVVCDQYNNEIFSLDKYFYSKGEHSHADVAVAPSETIAVSSYNVGETTVYVPYLVGEVGKTYEGIEPIVVNNDVNRISANHVPLGLQEPLFFVQDDENACIIGCSAQTEIPSSVSSKWEDASDTVSNNSAQWNIGTVYTAGDYIDIQDDVISVTGLQPAGDYAYNSAVSSKLDTTAFSTVSGNFLTAIDLTPYQEKTAMSGYLTTADSAQFYTNDNPSGFITGVDLSDYATTGDLANKLDTTAFSNVSGDFITALPADLVYTGDLNDYAKKDFVLSSIDSSTSGLLPTSSFSSVSGSFLTALPSDLISSHSGTIFVSGYEIEGTNSAVATANVQGFSTSLGIQTIGPWSTATFSWNKSLPNTVFSFVADYPNPNTTITYSANTNLTGEFIATERTAIKFDIPVPDATALKVWASDWFSMTGCIASAADSIGMTVGELAWASALPTYEYDSSDKISAINGSAIAVGGPYQPSGNYIPYTATENTPAAFKTNSGLWIDSITAGVGTNSTYIGDNSVQVRHLFGSLGIRDAVLSNRQLRFGYESNGAPIDSAYVDIEKIHKWDSASDYIQNNSATINDVNTSYQTNSGSFLTAVDLTPYQTTAGMTAYQSAGDYYSASNPSGFLVADDITGKLDASVYAADSGSFVTAVPDTYLQNTDLSTEDGKVTAISGIPLSAGGDVPEGVMVESAVGYNAVNEISGYNGSAIAQYGAEKQWLQHDDTIVHVSNSAQYAFGCNISALQRLMGIDETILYNNTAATTADVAIGSTFDISEPITNFNKFKIYFSRFSVTSTGAADSGPCAQIREYDSTACSAYFVINETFPKNTAQNADWFDISMLIETRSGTTWKCKACYQSKLPSGSLDRGWTYLKPYKVIGIGRISG